jgi:ATPase subunit of ABC transporter with duplicated ATPase domains
VSHDRYFVDALATHVWALEKGNLYVTKGGYAVFRNARQVRRQAESERADQATNQRQKRKQLTASEKTGQRGQYRRQKEMKELEQAIESAEDRLSKLALELEEASQSQLVERVRELGQDYRAVEDELAYLLDQWAKIGEAA